MATLFTTMTNNIGQIKIEDSDNEIKRLEKSFPNTKWRKDFSEFIYVVDESDEDVNNPCELKDGYCWVVCD